MAKVETFNIGSMAAMEASMTAPPPVPEPVLPELDGLFVELCEFAAEPEQETPLFGRALWCAPIDRFMVQTLDGACALVPRDWLRAATTSGSSDASDWSRFDAFWPPSEADGQAQVFAAIVLEYVLRKGFCRVKMPPSEKAARDEVVAWATKSTDFNRLRPELEQTYLGGGDPGREEVVWMMGDEAQEALNLGQRRLAGLHAVLLPLLGSLGFHPSAAVHRMLLRRPVTRRSAAPPALSNDDVEEGVVESHIDFVRRRRLCAMYALPGTRQKVNLTPNKDSGAKPQSVPLAEDGLLLFGHDVFSYTCTRGASDLVLQTWFMEEQQLLRTDRYEGEQENIDEILGLVRGPRETHIRAIACRLPMACTAPGQLPGAFASQTDGYIKIPYGRWDMDAYYDDSGDRPPGTCVSQHAGLVADELVTSFDNAMFGMTYEDALETPPTQRMVLEVGLEAAMRGGHGLKDMQGANIHAFVGDEGNDTEERRVGTAARLSYILGLVGPSQTVKTACSSAMVAVCLCHQSLHAPQPAGIRMGLAIGAGLQLSVFSYLGLSQALMLGPGGRSFTFDASANGYNKGEGCGGLLLRAGENNFGESHVREIEERLAGLNGTAVMQDGRSATLTAPNGPAQGKCVQASLREAQVVRGGSVTFTELHGTGTALGDPVEVGSIRNAFRDRELPMLLGAGKSSHGHLEAGAGTAGLIKAIANLIGSVGPPNCHLRHLNSNCEIRGFPGLFPTEAVDMVGPTILAGVSAFGFGGTNSRADLFLECKDRKRSAARRKQNALRMKQMDFTAVQCPKCSKPMCWLCGAEVPAAISQERHRCGALREDSAKYDHCSRCFTGRYVHGGRSEE